MNKKISSQTTNKRAADKSDAGKIYVDEMYFRHVDQEERWRQEYEYHQTLETKIGELSRLSYEETDYAPQLERKDFQERTIPDFSYMLEKARAAAEGKYVSPVISNVAAVTVTLLILLISSSSLVLWLSGAGVVTALISLMVILRNRHDYIKKALGETQLEIERRIDHEKLKIEEERHRHEKEEDERIARVQELLNGETSSVFGAIEMGLKRTAFPFYVSLEVDLFARVPSIKVWLPPKAIIPVQTCKEKPSGRPVFEDKDTRMINRQYLELNAALLVKIASLIYGIIPAFDKGHIYGMSKDGQAVECLIDCTFRRAELIKACEMANGLGAIQRLGATFVCDTYFEMMPVDVKYPEEWGQIDRQFVRTAIINIFK